MGEIAFPAWDPVLLSLGFLQIRWYSLMYVVGFIAGHMILTRQSRDRFCPLPAPKVADLIFWLVLGVMLGGRIGYCLFYRQELILSWKVIAVWEGGLSFHGGFLGCLIAGLLFARKHGVSGMRLADCIVLGVTPGIFAVRCANFINGELYGRVTDATVAWAMRFPTDPVALRLMRIDAVGIRDREAALREAIDSGTWAAVMERVPLRHPSQLYEAVGEGLLVGLVLLVVYLVTRRRPLGSGVYGGIFTLGYGTARFAVEYFRQPDEQFRDQNDPLGTVMLGMTMGQVLCSAMILYGLVIIPLRWNKREGLRQDDPEAPPNSATAAS